MSMTQVTLSSSHLDTKSRGASELSDSLRVPAERMARILIESKLCVRITVGQETFDIGNIDSSKNSLSEFVFNSEKTFRRLMQRLRLIDFAAAYFDGSLIIRGPISDSVDILDAVNVASDQRQTFAEFIGRLIVRTMKMLIPTYGRRFESLEHYSKSAEAYELFLDRYMQYTCGHFKTESESIIEAQVNKFQLIERMVTKYLGPLSGKDHLDIGCGWGGMSAYFRDCFGTHSVGNTNCGKQTDYARRKYHVKIIEGDFSYLRKSRDRFDLITIVGMIEHLTPHRRSELLNIARELLKPGGVIYLQCIAKPRTWTGGDAYRVAKRHIFRGHFLETIEQTQIRLRDCGFTILDQVDDSRDYALTTKRWVENIQKNETKLTQLLGARAYRMYLGYLAYASKLFAIEGRGCLMRYVLQREKHFRGE